MKKAPLLALVALLAASAASAGDFFASPTGLDTNDGSLAHPWTITKALCSDALGNAQQCKWTPHAGDTIWLLDGQYDGLFNGNIPGSATAQTWIRGWSRCPVYGSAGHCGAIINGGILQNPSTFRFGQSYLGIRDVEITSEPVRRQTEDPGWGGNESWPRDVELADGINSDATLQLTGNKIVNVIVHDTRQALSLWSQMGDKEAYGAILFYSGWKGLTRGHGHNIYTQNNLGEEWIENVYAGYGFQEMVQAYGSSVASLNNFRLWRNILHSASSLGDLGGRNLTLGGTADLNNAELIGNSIYCGPLFDCGTSDLYVGYNSNCVNLKINGNTVWGSWLFGKGTGCTTPAEMTGNFVGPNPTAVSPAVWDASKYPNNTFAKGIKPANPIVNVYPNKYEQGRAHVAIFNFPQQPTVAVDLGDVLNVGQEFEVRNLEDVFNSPILMGTWTGAPVNFPAGKMSTAQPKGFLHTIDPQPTVGPGTPTPVPTEHPYPVPAPPGTGPEFNAYLVRAKIPGTFVPSKTPTPGGSTPTPSATPAPSVTPTPALLWNQELPVAAAVIVAPVANNGGVLSTSVDGQTVIPAGTASWTFTVANATTVRVWANVWTGDAQSDSWHTRMDGGPWATFDSSLDSGWPAPPVWNWVKVNARAPFENPRLFAVAAGQHTLTFGGREIGSLLRDVYVTNDPSFMPPPFVPPAATATPTATMTDTPTATATRTATWTFTATSTATPTASPSPTSSPSATPSPTPTSTSTRTATATATPSFTSTPTLTATATPTATKAPPTVTPTATKTATSVPPSKTPTRTPTWTNQVRDQHIRALEIVVYTATPTP
ncbi:MAG TPA: hypothetical protein PLB01_00370 [Thermoanaerobaculia bacterium]|nr:hypothetical protein [Thermoanaerobaculia bacterium]